MLESQEFHAAKVHAPVETQAALIGADGAVELAAVAGVGVPGAVVRHPADAENEGPFRLHHAVEQVCLFILGMLCNDGFQGRKHFFDGLNEFGLVGAARFDVFNHTGKVRVHHPSSLL